MFPSLPSRKKHSLPQTLRAHKGGVTGLAVHPSGALALSVGRDRGMRLWDLIKG